MVARTSTAKSKRKEPSKLELLRMRQSLARRNKDREKLKAKQVKLRDELMLIEKKLLPQNYSYQMFLYAGQKYIQFPSDYAYPLDMVRGFIQTCAKHKTERPDTLVVGLVMQIPNMKAPFRKKKFTTKPRKAPKRVPEKRKKKNANKLPKRSRQRTLPRKKAKKRGI